MGAKKGITVAQQASRGLDGERIIANALVDVASELRLTDVVELINLIHNDQAANLADLINSSTELFYRSGTLRYALSATFEARWNATPQVALDLEFCHQNVAAFFRLTIGEKRAAIEITDILFEEQGLDEGAKEERLVAAFASARRPKDSRSQNAS